MALVIILSIGPSAACSPSMTFAMDCHQDARPATRPQTKAKSAATQSDKPAAKVPACAMVLCLDPSCMDPAVHLNRLDDRCIHYRVFFADARRRFRTRLQELSSRKGPTERPARNKAGRKTCTCAACRSCKQAYSN